MTNKNYKVYFQGVLEVEATSKDEAKGLALDKIFEVQDPVEELDINITTVDEGECAECGGTGKVDCDEDDGEGHTQRGVGERMCMCRVESEI